MSTADQFRTKRPRCCNNGDMQPVPEPGDRSVASGIDSIFSEKPGSPNTKISEKVGEANSTPRKPAREELSSSSTSKRFLKVYTNGYTNKAQSLHLENLKNAKNWAHVLEVLSDALVKTTRGCCYITEVFTTNGQRLESIADLSLQHEIVVCGPDDYFKRVPYGNQTPQLLPSNELPSLGRKAEDLTTKSLIVEPSFNTFRISRTSPLVKSASEQNVSNVGIFFSNTGYMSTRLSPRDNQFLKRGCAHTSYKSDAPVHVERRWSANLKAPSLPSIRLVSSTTANIVKNNWESAPNVIDAGNIGRCISAFKGTQFTQVVNPIAKNDKSSTDIEPSSRSDGCPSEIPSYILSKYRVGEILGQGTFAVVSECTDLADKRYALKVITKPSNKDRLDVPPETEASVLGQLSHPNIISLFDQYNTETKLYLVLELLENGNLYSVMADVKTFAEEEAKVMTKDVASALEYLHKKNIVHRDVKPQNLLVYYLNELPQQRRLKLGDFGFARVIRKSINKYCGTPRYIAPEMLAKAGYGLKVDIWALGVLVYVMLSGRQPFQSDGCQNTLFGQIRHGKIDLESGDWEKVSQTAKDFVGGMIVRDPKARMTAGELLAHPWLAVSSQDRVGEL